jgi:predicted cupin superfamily sugar epimerase
MATLDADATIDLLGMQPHPEGGWFTETYRDTEPVGGRPHSTAIYFLLRPGEESHWHRVDAAEGWHHYAGGPLELLVNEGDETRTIILGTDLAAGQRPQFIVPKDAWQAARPIDEAVLVGCTVAPGFDFAGFELAPPGWEP